MSAWLPVWLALVGPGWAQDAAPAWTVERSGPGEWPEVRRVSVDGDPPFLAWPSLVDTPHLVVDCDDGRLRVYVATHVQPEVYGDSYDRWLTAVTLRFDDEDAREVSLRKDVAPGQLHFRQARKWVRTLRVHALLHLQIVPFGSNPTTTTFSIAGLDDVVDVVSERCRL